MANSAIDSHLLEEFEQLHLMSTNSTVITASAISPSSFGSLALESKPLLTVSPSSRTTSFSKPFQPASPSISSPLNRAFLPPQPSIVRPNKPAHAAFQMPSPSGSTARSLAQIARSAQLTTGQVSTLRAVAPNPATASPPPTIASASKANPKPVPYSSTQAAASSGASVDSITFTMVPLIAMDSGESSSLGVLLTRPSSLPRTAQATPRAVSTRTTPISTPSAEAMEQPVGEASAGVSFEELTALFSIARQREAAVAREAVFAPARAPPASNVVIRPFAFNTPSPDDLALLHLKRKQRS